MLDQPPIYAVPSVHGDPFFASQVRIRAKAVRPQAIAIEIVAEALEAFTQAVRRFPRLSGVVSDQSQLIPIVPTDSLAQGARTAIELGLPLYAVDIPRNAEVPDPGHTIVPPPIGEHVGFEEYYATASRLVAPAPSRSPDDLRERSMAARLRELGDRHGRVLFICGLAHWEAIKGHLHRKTEAPAHLPSPPFRVVHMKARAAYHYTGQIPYAVAAFETSKSFSTQRTLARLYLDACGGSDVRLGTRDQRALQRYARNLAVVEQGVAPSLFEITLSAKANVSDPYAVDVYQRALSYPWDDEAEDLDVLDVGPSDNASLNGAPRQFTLQGTWRNQSVKRIVSLASDASHDRRHPNGDASGARAGREAWGRYMDEALAEERFFDYLKRFAVARTSAGEWKSEPFQSGLMDGIDARSTLLDRQMHPWVKILEKGAGPVGAILVEFDPARGGDDAYTYAAHLGLGLYRNVAGVNPGVDLCKWSSLVTFFRRIRPRHLFGLYDRWTGDGGSAAGLRFQALAGSPERRVVYVTATPPSSEDRWSAARLGKRILHVPIGDVSKEALERACRFHIYWK